MLKLAVFDVDGTLTKVESCWRFVHEKLGTWEKGGKRNAELYFNGVISYEEWARLDASLWRGLSIEKIRGIISEIPYMDGVREAFSFLRENNVKIVLLTAGLSLLAERIAREIGVDDYVANELETENGKVTGRVKVRVSVSNKGEVLEELMKRFDAKPYECMAVGDDETMIPVFRKVALSIAFNPCSVEVEKQAKIVVKARNLKEIIPHIEEFMKRKSNV
ncbi:HAD-IB family phosphatase [Candidatus Bathyarchaeota archaeon]|nr:HAD-IB family phosphatase [Candidatus Bathyarchaeota archaeon]